MYQAQASLLNGGRHTLSPPAHSQAAHKHVREPSQTTEQTLNPPAEINRTTQVSLAKIANLQSCAR